MSGSLTNETRHSKVNKQYMQFKLYLSEIHKYSKSKKFKIKRLEIPVQLQLPLFHNVCRTNDQSEYTADMYFFQPEWHAFFLKAVDHHS